MRFNIELDDTLYRGITRATLHTDLNDYTSFLTLAEGPGNVADQIHPIYGDAAHLRELLRQCEAAGIPTHETSAD